METSEQRSRTMRAVKDRDTGLEMTVRRLVHAFGYRYRLHRRDLPGKPDLVFPSRRKVIFVNGCFWHQHDCPRGSRRPKANHDYWNRKLERTKKRDRANIEALHEDGWEVLVVWECEARSTSLLAEKIRDFLE